MSYLTHAKVAKKDFTITCLSWPGTGTVRYDDQFDRKAKFLTITCETGCSYGAATSPCCCQIDLTEVRPSVVDGAPFSAASELNIPHSWIWSLVPY